MKGLDTLNLILIIDNKIKLALKEFLNFAEGEVRSLASLYSGVGRSVDALILYFGEDPSRCPFEQEELSSLCIALALITGGPSSLCTTFRAQFHLRVDKVEKALGTK